MQLLVLMYMRRACPVDTSEFKCRDSSSAMSGGFAPWVLSKLRRDSSDSCSPFGNAHLSGSKTNLRKLAVEQPRKNVAKRAPPAGTRNGRATTIARQVPSHRFTANLKRGPPRRIYPRVCPRVAGEMLIASSSGVRRAARPGCLTVNGLNYCESSATKCILSFSAQFRTLSCD